MAINMILPENFDEIYHEINTLITDKKDVVKKAVNNTMLNLYWKIGQCLTEEILANEKAEYGKRLVTEISIRLSLEYGKGFNRASLFRMIQFYQEFKDFEKVATLSQQLTWSHFVELLPIEDEIKRDFYATMC